MGGFESWRNVLPSFQAILPSEEGEDFVVSLRREGDGETWNRVKGGEGRSILRTPRGLDRLCVQDSGKV